MNVRARLEFEFASKDATVQHICHYVTQAPHSKRVSGFAIEFHCGICSFNEVNQCDSYFMNLTIISLFSFVLYPQPKDEDFSFALLVCSIPCPYNNHQTAIIMMKKSWMMTGKYFLHLSNFETLLKAGKDISISGLLSFRYISLVNGISTYMSHLKPKPSLQKNRSGVILHTARR